MSDLRCQSIAALRSKIAIAAVNYRTRKDLRALFIEIDRLQRIESAARALVSELPKCRCGNPATRAYRYGRDRWCDACVDGAVAVGVMGEGGKYAMPREYKRAASLRELVTLLGERTVARE